MTELVKYEAACRAVAAAASIDEAKDFRDKSEAMRAYAKQAKNKQLEVQAAEIRIRAERRIGELMAAQREEVGTAQGRRSDLGFSETQVASAPVTLAEAGIDKNLADRARKYAAIPEPEFNGIVGEWKERVEQENERVTVNLLTAGAKAEAAPTPAPEPEEQIDPEVEKVIRKHAGLTREALLRDYAELVVSGKAERAALKAEIEALKSKVALFEADSEIGRKLGLSLRENETLKGRMSEYMQIAKREEYKRKKAEARVAELEKMGVAL